VDAVPGADFDYAAMIIRVGVDEDGLRMRLFEHRVQVCKEEISIETVPGCICCGQSLIGFGEPDDLYQRTVQRLIQKAVDMSMDQANDGDAEWCSRAFGGGLAERVRSSAEED
jgi:hypothetical protein